MSGEATVTTYVRCLYPGVFMPEESTRAVSSRDPGPVAREADPGVFAFSFFDRASTTVTVGGREITTTSKPFNETGLYYIDAESLTAGDVAALPGDHHILLSNMRANHWDTMLRCRTGNFRPLVPGDSVISSGEGE